MLLLRGCRLPAHKGPSTTQVRREDQLSGVGPEAFKALPESVLDMRRDLLALQLLVVLLPAYVHESMLNTPKTEKASIALFYGI